MEHATFIGIDVAKDQLDVHFRPTDEAFHVDYDDAGLVTLLFVLGLYRFVTFEETAIATVAPPPP